MRVRPVTPASWLALLAVACFADRGPPEAEEDTADPTSDPEIVALCNDGHARRAEIVTAQCQCQVDRGTYPDLPTCLTASGGVTTANTCACETYGAYPEVRAGLECTAPAQMTALACLAGVTCTADTQAFDACINPYFTAISTCAAPPKSLLSEVELTCGQTAPFACGSGETIPESWSCDFNIDCEDGSDERDCPGAFLCDDGATLIPENFECDSIDDCPDQSDETGCPTFMCNSGNVLPLPLRCDGFNDCSDNSDELNCPTIQCMDGPEILETSRCDTFPHCPAGDDELNCPTFMCINGATIPTRFQCDYQPDCPLGEDEDRCLPYPCFNGNTLPAKTSCDGKADCSQGEDEELCPFLCPEGYKIPPDALCDDFFDCIGGADELSCK